MRAEFARFLLVGASNTLFSYLLYLILLNFMPYLAAYTLSYCAGISPTFAMIGILIVTIPVTFIASRFVLKR